LKPLRDSVHIWVRTPYATTLITQVLAADVALLGPAPARVFDQVPFPDVLDAIVVGVDH
jgi:hypothetical protein